MRATNSWWSYGVVNKIIVNILNKNAQYMMYQVTKLIHGQTVWFLSLLIQDIVTGNFVTIFHVDLHPKFLFKFIVLFAMSALFGSRKKTQLVLTLQLIKLLNCNITLNRCHSSESNLETDTQLARLTKPNRTTNTKALIAKKYLW